MKRINILAGLIILILFSSCEKDLLFSNKNTESRITVNSFITPDSILTARITESKFFLASGEGFNLIENAEVKVYINNVYKENMVYSSDGNYRASFAPKTGENIRLEISVPGLESVNCESKIEDQAVTLSLDTTISSSEVIPILNGNYDNDGTYNVDTVGYSYNCIYNYTLRFRDPSAEQNYYRLVVKTITEYDYGFTNISYDFDFTDIVSGNKTNSDADLFSENNTTNTYHIFSDELFNGKEYALKFRSYDYIAEYLPEYYHVNENHITKKSQYITLQTISKSYYLFLKSKDMSGSENPFAEPVQIHSNVEGGCGILGSYNCKTYSLEL